MNASAVNWAGFGLALFIMCYVVFLYHLILEISKESKLIQRYSTTTNTKRKKWILVGLLFSMFTAIALIIYLVFI